MIVFIHVYFYIIYFDFRETAIFSVQFHLIQLYRHVRFALHVYLCLCAHGNMLLSSHMVVKN